MGSSVGSAQLCLDRATYLLPGEGDRQPLQSKQCLSCERLLHQVDCIRRVKLGMALPDEGCVAKFSI